MIVILLILCSIKLFNTLCDSDATLRRRAHKQQIITTLRRRANNKTHSNKPIRRRACRENATQCSMLLPELLGTTTHRSG